VVVLLRLLGPFTAVAGRPTTLCWRLERSGADEAGQPTRVQYEVTMEVRD
jgi:hypothetical protein